MAKTIQPLHDRLLVKRLESDETTASGIIIPDSAKEKAQCGSVIAAGPGITTSNGSTTKMSVKAGDTVLFGKFAGTDISFEGNEYLIIREDELLGVISQAKLG